MSRALLVLAAVLLAACGGGDYDPQLDERPTERFTPFCPDEVDAAWFVGPVPEECKQ